MTNSVVVLIVGIPGAGKTTLIDRAASSPEWTVLDPDRFRRRLSPALRKLPIPYPLYVVAVIVAIARHTHVVAESRGTYAWLRRLVALCARVNGRDAALVLLDASSEDAVAGQVRRGRIVPPCVMRWFTTDWRGLLAAARSGQLASEGWSRVLVLDCAQASEVEDLGELVHGSSAVHRDGDERREADQKFSDANSSDLSVRDEQ